MKSHSGGKVYSGPTQLQNAKSVKSVQQALVFWGKGVKAPWIQGNPYNIELKIKRGREAAGSPCIRYNHPSSPTQTASKTSSVCAPQWAHVLRPSPPRRRDLSCTALRSVLGKPRSWALMIRGWMTALVSITGSWAHFPPAFTLDLCTLPPPPPVRTSAQAVHHLAPQNPCLGPNPDTTRCFYLLFFPFAFGSEGENTQGNAGGSGDMLVLGPLSWIVRTLVLSLPDLFWTLPPPAEAN